jgi:hypothetical protein
MLLPVDRHTYDERASDRLVYAKDNVVFDPRVFKVEYSVKQNGAFNKGREVVQQLGMRKRFVR